MGRAGDHGAPGGSAGNHMPTNNLDNNPTGGGGRTTDARPASGGGHTDTPSTSSGGRDLPGGLTAENGLPGGSTTNNGIPGSGPRSPRAWMPSTTLPAPGRASGATRAPTRHMLATTRPRLPETTRSAAPRPRTSPCRVPSSRWMARTPTSAPRSARLVRLRRTGIGCSRWGHGIHSSGGDAQCATRLVRALTILNQHHVARWQTIFTADRPRRPAEHNLPPDS